MSKRAIIWLSVIGLILIFFLYLIPIDVYDQNSMLLSFTGGAIFFGCLFQFLGNFNSVYELFEKQKPNQHESPGRRMAPVAVIPGFIFVFILVFHHSGRKQEELAQYGVLTKGKIKGGQSSTTTRRFRTNTSYSIDVIYQDSLHRKHTFEASVNGSEFGDLYEGAQIDVVYSKRYPALAKAVLSVMELSKIKKIPQEKINLGHLLSIIEGQVKEDSILHYLNTINYEWIKGSEESYYINDKLNLAINLSSDKDQIAYVQKVNAFAVRGEDHIESNIGEYGFKKKASNVN